MQFTINKANLKKEITILIAVCIFTLPVVRFAAGFEWYLITSIPIALFVCLDFLILQKGKADRPVYYLLFMLVVIFFSVLVTRPHKAESLFFSSISIVCFISALWLTKLDRLLLSKASLYSLFVFYLFFVISALIYGFEPKQINLFLKESSRNVVGAIVLFLQIMYSSSYYRTYNKLPLITPIITTFISFLAFGRSGIVISLAILLFSYSLHLVVYGKSITKVFLFFIFAASAAFIFYEISFIINFFDLYTNFKGGVSSPRSIMNTEYVNGMSFSNFIAGVDLSLLPTISSYNNNPHNSFVFSHSQFGVLYLFFLSMIVFFVFYMFIFFKRTTVYLFLLLLFLARCFTDVLSLLGVFDVVFYLILFFIYESYKEKNVRKIWVNI